MASYKRERPSIAIRFVASRNLGRCYNSYTYKVTSTRKLTRDQIVGLRDLGLLGSGQSFSLSQCDGNEEPAGHDTVQCVDENGQVARNKYSGKLYEPREEPYYVYTVVNRIDSGD